MSRQIHLLAIDEQNDFCNPKGSLFVTGADQNVQRVAAFIARAGDKIDEMHFTMDSHQVTHIAHPISWQDKNGNAPAPFTLISEDDVINGVWRARNPRKQQHFAHYVSALKKNARYALVIWPPHCLIGSWGHGLVPEISQALIAWSSKHNRPVDYVTKGSNDFTEHYSGVQADVPLDWDPLTKLNTRLIDTLKKADEIIIVGEALSHCVCNTVTDIATNFGPDQVAKFVLLTDCSSSVPGFEKLGTDFIANLTKQGMRTALSTDYLK